MTKRSRSKKADLKAAESWKGKFIRDVQVNDIGLILAAKETKQGLRLVARFPGDKKTRLIALEPTEDLECLVPGLVKARYRPPRPEDIEAMRARRKKSTS